MLKTILPSRIILQPFNCVTKTHMYMKCMLNKLLRGHNVKIYCDLDVEFCVYFQTTLTDIRYYITH